MTRNLTQVAGSFIGTMEEFHTSDKKPLVSPNIHITDSQTDKILDTIPLGEFWDDNHHKSLIDTIEMFDFKTFGSKRYSQHLTKMNRIIIPDEDGTYIEFIIDTPIKYRSNDSLIVEVYTSASYLQLKKAKVITPQKITDTASQHLGFALNGTEFRPGIVESNKIRTIDIERHTNPYAYIKRIANEFELEPRFRVETDGNKVIGRYVDLLERVGEWQGREVEFGKDLLGIQRKEDFSNIVTALIGLGPEREDGTRLEVFVEDEEALQRWGRRNPQTGELMHLIEVYEPESFDPDMTIERLTELTRNELEKRINSVVEYIADVADLERVPGMENKKIRFGDTIKIRDTGFNPPLYLEARVHTQDRSLSQPEKKKVILGDYIEYTEEEVHAIWESLQSQIRKRLEKLVLVNIVSSAGNVFKNGVGLTQLTAKTFLSGAEVDEDGTKYEYRWHKFDKDGNYVPGFYEEGKTITVSADTIDEKASFRVEIIQDDEVLTLSEITLANVFDGEDGEPGPPGPKGDSGPKGEDGQSVDDITIEYYLSDSDLTPSGGTWEETKPPYVKGKYLWTRQRITYKNPTEIEYTTPVLDDSWKAVELAEEAKEEAQEAKQEAQNAMQTADGKNTVFRQSTTPPTTNRKIGDLWFKTDEGNKMYVWTGSWTETKLDYQALSVNKLSAISADLGNVTAGDIRGVTMNLGNGKFMVDENGNIYFAGELDGATGTFRGNLTTTELKIGPETPNIPPWSDGTVAIKVKMLERISNEDFRFLEDVVIKLLNNEVTFTRENPLAQTKWIFNGTVIADELNISSSSKNENGYTNLPNGLILQWGVSYFSDTDALRTVTFPIAFPNICLNAIVAPQYNGDNWRSVINHYTISQLFNNRFTFYYYLGHNLDPAAPVAGGAVRWMAIGY